MNSDKIRIRLRAYDHRILDQSATEIVDTIEEFTAHRHDHFRSTRRRRCPNVGCKIDQRPVGLVSDRRDQRNFACRRGANDNFVVEPPEVF